jgi:hypothetical protein
MHFNVMKSDLPKSFPDQGFLEVASRLLPFDFSWRPKMACQPGTGKVKRIATMLHREAAGRTGER